MKSLPIVFGRPVGDVIQPLQTLQEERAYEAIVRSKDRAIERAILACITGDGSVSDITVNGEPLLVDGEVATVVGGSLSFTSPVLPGRSGWHLDRVPPLHEGPITAGIDLATDRIEIDLAVPGLSVPLYLTAEERAALDAAVGAPAGSTNRRARRAAAAVRRRRR